jgi:hypothetical protein
MEILSWHFRNLAWTQHELATATPFGARVFGLVRCQRRTRRPRIERARLRMVQPRVRPSKNLAKPRRSTGRGDGELMMAISRRSVSPRHTRVIVSSVLGCEEGLAYVVSATDSTREKEPTRSSNQQFVRFSFRCCRRCATRRAKKLGLHVISSLAYGTKSLNPVIPSDEERTNSSVAQSSLDGADGTLGQRALQVGY